MVGIAPGSPAEGTLQSQGRVEISRDSKDEGALRRSAHGNPRGQSKATMLGGLHNNKAKGHKTNAETVEAGREKLSNFCVKCWILF